MEKKHGNPYDIPNQYGENQRNFFFPILLVLNGFKKKINSFHVITLQFDIRHHFYYFGTTVVPDWVESKKKNGTHIFRSEYQTFIFILKQFCLQNTTFKRCVTLLISFFWIMKIMLYIESYENSAYDWAAKNVLIISKINYLFLVTIYHQQFCKKKNGTKIFTQYGRSVKIGTKR